MAKNNFMWICSNNDGTYYDKSSKGFATEEECYNDMRNAALEKMKWNTEYAEDFEGDEEDTTIGYNVSFGRKKIVHKSYSGTYTYQIVPYMVRSLPRIIIDGELYGLTEEETKKVENEVIEAINEKLNELVQTKGGVTYLHITSIQHAQ